MGIDFFFFFGFYAKVFGLNQEVSVMMGMDRFLQSGRESVKIRKMLDFTATGLFFICFFPLPSPPFIPRPWQWFTFFKDDVHFVFFPPIVFKFDRGK